MKICIYTQDVTKYLGGVQRVVTTVSEELIRIGHQVTILCPLDQSPQRMGRKLSSEIELVRVQGLFESDRNSAKDQWSRVILALAKRAPVSTLPKILNPILRDSFTNLYHADRIVEFLNSQRFDAVIGAGPQQSLLLATVSHKIRAKAIGWQHSTFAAYFRKRGNSLYGLENLARDTYPELDQVLVLNSKDCKEFEHQLNTRTLVFPNPVPASDLSVHPDYGLKSIIYVGRVEYASKGVDLLLEAFRLVHAKHPDWNLKIYGDGPNMVDAQTLTKKHELVQNVQFMGVTSRVHEALSSGSIFVSPSRIEGFGLSLVEAMQFGLPSVSYRNDGPEDIISDGDDGLLVEPGNIVALSDALTTLIENRPKRESMGRSARISSEKYSTSALVPKFLAIIEGCN